MKMRNCGLILMLVFAFIGFGFLIGCGDNGHMRTPTQPEQTEVNCTNDDACFWGGEEDNFIYFRWKVECWVGGDDRLVYGQTVGKPIHLHFHILYPDAGHSYLSDVLRGVSIDSSNWARFDFGNYAQQIGVHRVRMRFWGSVGPFGLPNQERWGCIPPPERNVFYRLDCAGQPGFECYVYNDGRVTSVDPSEPCDPWSDRTDPNNY